MRGSLTSGLLISFLSAGLIVAGCGGDNNNTTTTLSKQEFLKKGNAICRKANQDVNKAGRLIFLTGVKKGQKPSGPPPAAKFKKFADTILIPSIQSQINQIRALGVPPGDQAQVKAILDAAQAALNKGKQDPTLLEGNKSTPFAKANKLALAYGLTVCGSG
jgi:hypothetical protein